MATLGLHSTATLPITALTRGASVVLGALSTAGVGAFLPQMLAKVSATNSISGVGVFSPIGQAWSFGTVTSQGSGGLGTFDNPASVASFGGLGLFAAVGYAFYADAEKAAPKQEVRVVFVPYADRHPEEPPVYAASEPRATYAQPENRVAVVPFENRVYEVSSKQQPPRSPNRRRTI